MAKPNNQTWANFSPLWNRTAKQKKLFTAKLAQQFQILEHSQKETRLFKSFALFFFQFKLHRLQQTGDKLSLPENWNFSRRRCDKICRLTRPQYILPWQKGALEAWHENWGGGAISKTLLTRYIKVSELCPYIVGLLHSFQNKQKKQGVFLIWELRRNWKKKKKTVWQLNHRIWDLTALGQMSLCEWTCDQPNPACGRLSTGSKWAWAGGRMTSLGL